MTVTKICKTCGSPKVQSGKRLICAPCNRKRVLAYQKAFPEKANARSRTSKQRPVRTGWTRVQAEKLWRRYRMTPDEYEDRRSAQMGKCAICHQISDPLVVDHNHALSQPRELLCKSCNFGIGLFAESAERLRNAATYLEKHSK